MRVGRGRDRRRVPGDRARRRAAALAGGAEAPLSPLVYGAFTIIRAMSTRNDAPQAASRPFDRARDGFVMAEGAGVLLLERLEDARARGARVYGEIAGYGLTNDAHHMSAPRPDGTMNAAAMRRALDEAELAPGDVDIVNAHGSGTPLGDRCEALAMELVFGARAPSVPVTATKGQHGHALGATGAWEAALSVAAITRGIVPRSVNADDADCDLAVTRERLDRPVRTVLSNSAGFGGINAALVFRDAGDAGVSAASIARHRGGRRRARRPSGDGSRGHARCTAKATTRCARSTA